MINLNANQKIEYLNSNLANQHTFEKILLAYVEKLSSALTHLSSNYLNDVLDFLDNLKNALMYASDNIKLINSTLDSLNNIEECPDEELENINNNYYKNLSLLSKNTAFIEELILNIIKFMELKFSDKKNEITIKPLNDVNSTKDITNTDSDKEIKNEDENRNETEKPEEEKMPDNLVENTLIISETKGKVILPYYFNDLKKLYNLTESTNEEDKNYEDIIEKNYTLPIEDFKTPAIARFREAFKLARKKEKTSVKFAFDLGMELLFNYNLHPAIITACRNLDELDIYLDYLDNNETEKFNCFNIIFEIAPVISKKASKKDFKE